MKLSIQNATEYYRYCPGEERIKLSDAVCLGRRRSNFPKCKGCQFNDDEKEGVASRESRVASQSTPLATRHSQLATRVESVFKSYDVRGIYPDPLDAEVAWRVGHAAAQFLRSELRGYDRGRAEKSAVVVGRDMRKSSPELMESLIEGLQSGGSTVIDVGMIDTPQLYFAVNHLTCCGGVQVTASHNPAQYNGFKICGQKGRPVGVETGLGKICKIAMNTIRHGAAQASGRRSEDLSEAYRQFVLGFLKRGEGRGTRDEGRHTEPEAQARADSRTEATLACASGSVHSPVPRPSSPVPLRVVVDASNGMAGRWFPLLFDGIEWLEIVRLNFEHNGEFVHDPNPLVESNLAQLKDRMLRSKAQLGVCFDGDADRCVFVDAEGRNVRADLMTALLAREFLKESAASAVVYDLRSSRVVPEEIRKFGGVPRRERCGHTFLKKALADCKGVFGGELSGHYYFRDNWYCDSAMLAFVHVLNLLLETGQSLAELIAPLQRYAHSGERNFDNCDPQGTIKRLAEKYADGEIDYLDGITVQYDDWWFNVRPSNTEPLLRLNIEARDEAMLKAKLAEMTPRLGKAVGH